ncbi:DUF397 domain-containing protein [Spirillospora sp. NBC_00431]
MSTLRWRKSSQSTQGTSGECVEVAQLTKAIGVRDSKHPEDGHLTLSRSQFADLVLRIKSTPEPTP